ncbi:MAG: hypothetical protein WKG00_04125 [Polyangiaceae bacterium]
MASVGFAAALKWGALGLIAAATLTVSGAAALRQPATPPPQAAPGAIRVAAARAAAAGVAATSALVAEARPEQRIDDARTEQPRDGRWRWLQGPICRRSPVPSRQVVPSGAAAAADTASVAGPAPPSAFVTPPRTLAPDASLAAHAAATGGGPTATGPAQGAAASNDVAASAPAERAAGGAPVTRARRTACSRAGAAGAVDARTLADEVMALDRARAALDAGDEDGALRALESRQRKHGSGRMGPEAALLRIRALLAKGDRPAATKLAAAHLASDPHGPFSARIRAALAESKKSSPRP